MKKQKVFICMHTVIYSLSQQLVRLKIFSPGFRSKFPSENLPDENIAHLKKILPD